MRMPLLTLLLLLLLLTLVHAHVQYVAAPAPAHAPAPGLAPSPPPPHTSTWAVIVSSSRSWLNYRHMANALSVYHVLKRMGMPDSHIILMLPEDIACHPRNGAYAAQVFGDAAHDHNMYGGGDGSSAASAADDADDNHIEVDFRGRQVCISSLLRVLHGRQSDDTPRSQRLASDRHSNVLLYLSGHGGDEFLKFHDAEELSAVDLAHALLSMHRSERYARMLLLVDTCEAATLFNHIRVPNVYAIASSMLDEKSYSRDVDGALGVPLIDRFTHEFWQFFFAPQRARVGVAREQRDRPTPTLADFFNALGPSVLRSTAELRYDFRHRPDDALDTCSSASGGFNDSLLHRVDRDAGNDHSAALSDDRDDGDAGATTFTSFKRHAVAASSSPSSSLSSSSSPSSSSLASPDRVPLSYFVSPVLAVVPSPAEYDIFGVEDIDELR